MTINEMGVVCGRMLKVNMNGSKLLKVSKSEEYEALNVQLGGDKLEVISLFFGIFWWILVTIEE